MFSLEFFPVKTFQKVETRLTAQKALAAKFEQNIKTIKEEMLIPVISIVLINVCQKSHFPNELKNAEVIAIFQKNDSNGKTNYRQISELPLVSKIYKKVLYEQIEKSAKRSYHPNCAIRKGWSTQNALLRFLKNWQKCLDKSGVAGTILVDLSKACDCLAHDLLIAKLAAYQ